MGNDKIFWKTCSGAMVELSYTTELSGICLTVKMGNNYHRRTASLLPLAMFILTKVSMPQKMVTEWEGTWKAGTHWSVRNRVPFAYKLRIWKPKRYGAGFQENLGRGRWLRAGEEAETGRHEAKKIMWQEDSSHIPVRAQQTSE